MDNWEEYLESQRHTKAAEQPQSSDELKNNRSSENIAATYTTMTAREKEKLQSQMVRVCPKCGVEYSYKTKTCPTCYERLPDAVSNEEAEDISLDIRRENGSDEPGISLKETKKKLRVGSILSLLAMAASILITGLHYLSIMKQTDMGSYGMDSSDQFFMYIFIFSNILLLFNLITCLAPKHAVKIMRTMRYIRYPRRYLFKYMEMSEEYEQQSLMDFTCKVCIVLPIISLILSAYHIYYFLHDFLHYI